MNKRQMLVLYRTNMNGLRTVIKTKHGRMIYLEIREINDKFMVKECYYLDRIRSGKYYATPQKLITKEFNESEILSVVATQLDRKYYGIEYIDKFFELSTDEFIKYKLNEFKNGYKFLIFVGEGEVVDGLPLILTTRIANRIHRKIYLKIKYYKDGLGVIEKCHYYDRRYKNRGKVMPQMLVTVFVEFNHKAIIDMINSELNCDFTDIIIAENNIDVENNTFALCGNI